MNLCVITGYKHEIPILLGMFGKDNLEYESKFDPSDFDNSQKQIYYHKKLDLKIILYKNEIDYLNESDDFLNSFNKLIFISGNTSTNRLVERTKKIKNSKTLFLWHFGEVFHKNFLDLIDKANYDFIYSGSNRIELEDRNNYQLDLQLPFRYFRYYIGYYWLEGLLQNLKLPKYNSKIPKIFSYIRAYGPSSWRNEFINNVKGLEEFLQKKDSANDGYDLLYPKYKHFEAINDYIYCNFNIIFETINHYNSTEVFLTEKTFKGLFFGKPFLLIAPYNVLNFLKDNGYYILNFEFKETIENSYDVITSVQNFVDWLKNSDEKDIEKKYNEILEKSTNNRKVLFEYLNDYSQSEKIFTNLLN